MQDSVTEYVEAPPHPVWALVADVTRTERAVSQRSARGHDAGMGDDGVRGVCVGPGDGEPLPAAGGRLLVGGVQTGGRLAAVRSSAPPGDVVPLHVHHGADECFAVLAGTYAVTCGDDTFAAGPGSFVYLPRGVPHGYRVGDEPGEKLILVVPAGFEEFFRDLDRDDVDLDELQHRHGITVLEA